LYTLRYTVVTLRYTVVTLRYLQTVLRRRERTLRRHLSVLREKREDSAQTPLGHLMRKREDEAQRAFLLPLKTGLNLEVREEQSPLTHPFHCWSCRKGLCAGFPPGYEPLFSFWT